MSIPTLTPEQLSAARDRATQAHRARAELKTKVRSGQVTLSEGLDEALADDTLSHIKVVDLLKCMPRVGDKRAAEIMERLDIAPNRRIRGLGRHQLDDLRAEFDPAGR